MKKIIVFAALIILSFSSLIASAQCPDGQGSTNGESHKYRMRLSENGEPHFAPPISQNDPLLLKDYWDSLFVDNSSYNKLIDKGLVTSIASDGDNLYLGGSFEYFEGIRCFNVIRYNRTSGIWSTLDSGFNATVEVLKIHNGKLYAGGRFNRVGFNGETPLQSIVVWDGAKWQQVGGGVNNTVHAIEFMDSSIIVGGDFTNTGGAAPVSYIAHWDGHTWDDMNGGVANSVYSLLAIGDSLFVGGTFYSRTTLLSGVVLYANNSWQSLGNGLDGPVYALAMFKGQLWVGGDYTTTALDDQQLYALARWDGTNWNAFGSGVDTGTKGQIYTITIIGDSIYIGGSFSEIAGVQAHGIIKWRNGNFSPLGNGVYGEVKVAAPVNGALYAGGTFLTAGNLSVNNIAKIGIGDVWKPIEASSGVYGGYSETYISAVAATSKYIFIGGSFSTIAGKPFNHIAAWDKINRKWVALGRGVDGEVESISIYSTNVYVGGGFNYAGDSIAKHIAYWDMNAYIWHPMGDGAVRFVSSIAANETGVYAAVYFPFVLNAGLYDYIGQWDGTHWNQINNTINGYVNAIAAKGSTLYIGGVFTYVDGQRSLHIAEYDGSNWYPLGTGLSDRVLSIVVAGTDVYAAGDFGNAGSLTVKGIARWDGNNWNDLAGGLNAPANSIAWDGSSLYVGGRFTQTNSNIAASHLAKWNGNTWSSVSNGTDYSIYGLAVDQAGLYIGGGFTLVNGGNLDSYRFGILHFGSAGVNQLSLEKLSAQNFPNPFTKETTIGYSLAHDGIVKIEIYDLLGTKIKTFLSEFKSAGSYDESFDASNFPSGTLYARISTGFGEVKTVKLVHEK